MKASRVIDDIVNETRHIKIKSEALDCKTSILSNESP
jgi:hypothetical protein